MTPSYRLYLQSDEWQLKRQEVFDRCGGICERCFNMPATQVHHLTYDRKYNEHLEDLKGLCGHCHQFVTMESSGGAGLGNRFLRERYLESLGSARYAKVNADSFTPPSLFDRLLKQYFGHALAAGVLFMIYVLPIVRQPKAPAKKYAPVNHETIPVSRTERPRQASQSRMPYSKEILRSKRNSIQRVQAESTQRR